MKRDEQESMEDSGGENSRIGEEEEDEEEERDSTTLSRLSVDSIPSSRRESKVWTRAKSPSVASLEPLEFRSMLKNARLNRVRPSFLSVIKSMSSINVLKNRS